MITGKIQIAPVLA